MKRVFVSGPAGWILCGCAVLAAGCGGGTKLPPLVPVTGTVTVDGQPVAGAQVGLWPQWQGAPPMQCFGTTDASGNFKVLTDGKEGAPVGQYKVTVTPGPGMMVPQGNPDPRSKPPMPVDMKYSNVRETDQAINVPEGGGNFPLALKKAPGP
jgi:hypothetical protein